MHREENSEAEASHLLRCYQGSQPQQTGRWVEKAAVPGFRDRRDGCEGGTKPMQPNLAVGGPALASLIASPHDMARLAEWRLNRCVLDIVTFFACQQVSMP